MPVVPEDREIARLVRIIAQAQGVWYCGWTGEEALKCGLRGLGVSNRRDGSVQALFAGPVIAVEEMINTYR